MGNRHENAIESTERSIHELNSIREKIIEKEQRLRSSGLASAKDEIGDVYIFLDTALSVDLTILPVSSLETIGNGLKVIYNNMKMIVDFSIANQSNPSEIWLSQLVQFRQQVPKHIGTMMPILAFACAFQKTHDKAFNQLHQIVEKAKSEASSIAQLADTTRNSVAAVGVGRHSGTFGTQAARHHRAATGWVFVAAIFALVTMGIGHQLLIESPVTGTIQDAAIIQNVILRVIVMSVLYITMVWAARNYRANKHQCIINQHRQLALTTFELFVKSSNDDDIKHAVLLAATNCIFAPIVTGYLGQEEEQHPSHIVDVIKSVTGQK